MVEQKVYKTRLCLLYQKGHCPRQTCHFAHGDAELRRFSGSFNGRRDYRDSDLRDKLVRRRSPPRRFSPGRDSRGRHSSQGYSPPKLIPKRSDSKRKMKHQFDGQSDFSGSLETSDETEGQVKAKKPKPFDSKDFLDEKLRGKQFEIDMLDHRKYQLQIALEERNQEADSLNSRIKELEMQLRTEKEECKRISSKIKKFIRAHNRHSRLQDELKRSEARLHKLGEKIYSDAIRSGPTEEDTSVNILSDAETFENHISNHPHNELQIKASPFKKRLVVEENEESKQGKPTAGERFISGPTRLQRLSKRGENVSTNVLRSSDKLKGSETGLLLPSTSIAAQAAEEVIEAIEMEEEKFENASFPKRVDKRGASENARLPFPLPPPPPLPAGLKAYLRYEGDNENADVDGLDEEAVDVDIV